jgi:hypothetical protein
MAEVIAAKEARWRKLRDTDDAQERERIREPKTWKQKSAFYSRKRTLRAMSLMFDLVSGFPSFRFSTVSETRN